MSFPKFSASIVSNCKSIRITDTSGVYNALSNPDGYGSPNPEITDVVSITAILTPPNGSESITLDFTDEIPASVVGNFQFTDQEIPYTDGLWIIEYIVETSTNSYSVKKQIYFTCNIRCCLEGAWASITEECSCKTKDDIIELMYMEGLYRSIKSASACAKSASKDAILRKLQRFCKNLKCKCH